MDLLEKDRVIQKQPWSFDKSLLVMKVFDGHSKLEAVNLSWCSFWVQAHGLPLGLMNEKIGTVLGDAIGDVEKVETNGDQRAWGRFLKIRVSINISKPLKRGKTIAVAK